MDVAAHFDLNNHSAYARWRDWRCTAYPAELDDLRVDIENPAQLTREELYALQQHLDRYNMAVYRSPEQSENKLIPLQIGRQFGLHRLDSNPGADSDSVTEIKVKRTGVHRRYIPYTSSKLSWHADGYYNAPKQQIRAMSLHCVRPAAKAGENRLLDPEMAYIYLRDLSPAYINALTALDALTIPANEIQGRVLRSARTGPVFSFDTAGKLHMRYSARKRNIEWKRQTEVLEAVAALAALFESNTQWILQGRLSAGEGLICNNVLHNRCDFEDDEQAPRLLYRLRYYDRVATKHIA